MSTCIPHGGLLSVLAEPSAPVSGARTYLCEAILEGELNGGCLCCGLAAVREGAKLYQGVHELDVLGAHCLAEGQAPLAVWKVGIHVRGQAELLDKLIVFPLHTRRAIQHTAPKLARVRCLQASDLCHAYV